jgi:hypothetical protein
MHRTSRRQARQDRGCRNVPRGHDGQTQQTGYPASHHPTHRTRFWLGSRSDCQRPWQVRCSADRDLPGSPPGHPLSRSRRLERKEPLSRAGERPNAAPRAGPSAIGWSTQRIVSCDVPSSRSDHRHESPTAAERADTSKRSRSPAPSRLSAVAGRERASARGWPASGGARLRWQRRR